MIDRLLSGSARFRHGILDDTYRPEQAIVGRTLRDEDNQRLTVVFPHWRGKGKLYDALGRRLSRQGSAVLTYQFHNQILEPRVDRVIDSFMYIKDSVLADIKELVRTHKYKEVSLIALSLGNASLALVASEFQEFTSATMVVVGSSLARGAWEGSLTHQLQADIAAQNMDEASLDEIWRQLNPIEHVGAFTGKDVLLYQSGVDTVIPVPLQHEMAAGLEAAGAHLEARYAHIGHAASITNFCLRSSPILPSSAEALPRPG